MVDDGTSLGPLERANGHWVVGNATRANGRWVEFRPDGLFQREPDSAGRLIPWSRIMSGIRITWGKHSWNINDKGIYTLKGTVAGRNGGWMHMTLRHPFEDDRMRFDRHARPYRAVDALRLEYLLGQLVADGTPYLLSDPDWVGRAVAYLAGGKNLWLTAPSLRRATAEALAAAGPAAPERSTAKPPPAS
ncbi:hypothetical protein OOT09_17905 [Streptomyces sp. NBC_00199]|nr:hypothetical protein [Streptomyces sp. NBC_00199]